MWHTITGYPHYLIADSLAIKSLHSGGRRGASELLKIKSNKQGYLYLRLTENRKRRIVFLHNLVATTFLPPRPDGHLVNHKNGVKADNQPQNLEWATSSENVCHAYRTGLRSSSNGRRHRTNSKHVRGEDSGKSKLTESDVRWLRTVYLHGNGEQLARHLGITRRAVRLVVTRKTWVHV